MSNNRINDISITDYTEKSFVIRGNTTPYKEVLKNFGGKWNDRLRDGEGWIFPMTKKSELEQWKLTGAFSNTRISFSNPSSENSQSSDKSNIILNEIKTLKNKIDKIEKLLEYIVKQNFQQKVEEELDTEEEGVEESKGEIIEEDSSEEEKIPVRRLLR